VTFKESSMQRKRTRWLAAVALIVYGAILIRLIVFKDIPEIHIGHLRLRFAGTYTGPSNLVPFKTIAAQLLGRRHHLTAMVNLLGNIIPFAPIGWLAPLVFPSMSWWGALGLGMVTGLVCEVSELVFRVGIFDVDDLMLNCLGVLAGYAFLVTFRARAQPAETR
jgi:glycopeptide antibiotics resistance protein